MNNVILLGNITRDPEIRYVKKADGSDVCMARTSIAVRRNVERNAGAETQTADFISLVAFANTAEFFEKYVQKGTALCIEGRIQTGSYKDKDGKTIYTTDVVAERAEFAGPKQTSEQPKQAPVDDDGFMRMPEGADDEMPFN